MAIVRQSNSGLLRAGRDPGDRIDTQIAQWRVARPAEGAKEMNRDELPRPDTSMIKEWFATLLNHEYRVYHHNSEARVVATTMGYAVTPAQAIEAAMAYAVNWNFNETRDNMTVTYLECEGVEVQVTSESPTTSSEIYGPGGYEDRGTR